MIQIGPASSRPPVVNNDDTEIIFAEQYWIIRNFKMKHNGSHQLHVQIVVYRISVSVEIVLDITISNIYSVHCLAFLQG